MTDLEKVKKGLLFHAETCSQDCPYRESDLCVNELCLDALKLLKEQEEKTENLKQTAQSIMEEMCLLKEKEPKQVIGIAESIEGMEVGYCPSCDRTIVNKKNDETKFCKFCGQAVRWELR